MDPLTEDVVDLWMIPSHGRSRSADKVQLQDSWRCRFVDHRHIPTFTNLQVGAIVPAQEVHSPRPWG
jgi:hypothetical protein